MPEPENGRSARAARPSSLARLRQDQLRERERSEGALAEARAAAEAWTRERTLLEKGTLGVTRRWRRRLERSTGRLTSASEALRGGERTLREIGSARRLYAARAEASARALAARALNAVRGLVRRLRR